MNIKKLFSYLAVAFEILLLSASPTLATSNVIFNNLPDPIPANIPSVGVEAYSMPEVGSQVQLVGSERTSPTVRVLMSSWGCEGGSWNLGTCTTSDGATFTHPITLNIYGVKEDNSPDTLIKTVTNTFTMPYRPSANALCESGKWSVDGGVTCFNGKAFTIDFDLAGTTLPEKIIIGVAYNTSHRGYAPMGELACFAEDGGCPYDSLNVGLTSSPTVGSVLPTINDIYQNSSYGGFYCDGGTAGTGSFRLDAGCWTGYLPGFKIETTTPDTTIPTTPVITGFKSPDMACGVITDLHSSTVDWSVSTDASGIAGYEYYVDYPLVEGGRGVWNPTTLWTATENFGSLNEGIHYIKVRAKDNAGNYSEWSNTCDITADWTAPSVTFSGFRDQSSASYDNLQPIKACGSVNNSGFISWEWTLGNVEANPVSYLYKILSGPTAVGYSATTGNTYYNGQIPLVGLYTVEVTGTDVAGNISSPVTCSVDYKLPVVDVCSNLDGIQTTTPVGYDSMGDGTCILIKVGPPTNKDQCKNDGWKTFNNPTFKNQGTCVSYVQANEKAGKKI